MIKLILLSSQFIAFTATVNLKLKNLPAASLNRLADGYKATVLMFIDRFI